MARSSVVKKMGVFWHMQSCAPTCICLIEDFEYSTCQLTKDVWNWLCFIFKTQLCKSSFQIHRLVVIKEKGFLCFCQANFMFLVVGSTVKVTLLAHWVDVSNQL